ncbi:11393_t:CDS:1 [Funneliformis geosporum]|uniref:7753_t:CDS:1 n=1 Tax=Funneliformis geosporum TaxID=1117311 RepID=A0A9W4SDW6_9GLOM|nr:11393_t:CDS:1 [Funneliformis geosporum]CAI2164760.1 7753_t:CDS:1 [Funneliformis geosporum]
MEHQYPDNTYNNGAYDYSQQQQYPSNDASNVVSYPGAEQVPPPIIMPQEKQPGSYTEPYSQHPSPPQQQQFPQLNMPTSPPYDNSYSPPAEPSYNNNFYNPPAEPSYNNNFYNPSDDNNKIYNPPVDNNKIYNPPTEPSYNNNSSADNNKIYNPPAEPSYNIPYESTYNNNNNNTYNVPYEPNNSVPEISYNTYNLPIQPTYSNNSYPEQYTSEPYTSSPNPPQTYNNNFYSNASPYITQPYISTQNYNNMQTSSAPPPPPPKESSPAPFSAPSSVPLKPTYDQSPKPPKNYETPNLPRPPKNSSSPHSEAPLPSSYTPSSMIPSNQSRPESPNNHREKKKSNRQRRDESGCADCFSLCGCIRCTCTIIIFFFAAVFIIGGIFSLTYSKILPGKCQGICDPTNGGGIPNPGGKLPNGNNPIDQANNEFKNGTQSCSNVCSESVFNILFYVGLVSIGFGAFLAITQILCMCCRVGSSGGKGSGCCYCF